MRSFEVTAHAGSCSHLKRGQLCHIAGLSLLTYALSDNCYVCILFRMYRISVLRSLSFLLPWRDKRLRSLFCSFVSLAYPKRHFLLQHLLRSMASLYLLHVVSQGRLRNWMDCPSRLTRDLSLNPSFACELNWRAPMHLHPSMQQPGQRHYCL